MMLDMEVRRMDTPPMPNETERSNSPDTGDPMINEARRLLFKHAEDWGVCDDPDCPHVSALVALVESAVRRAAKAEWDARVLHEAILVAIDDCTFKDTSA